MSAATKWIGAASISAEPDRCLTTHRVTGVVTPSTIGVLVNYARRDAAPARVMSYVEAVIAIESDKLFACAWREGWEPLEAPVALLVRPDQLSACSEYVRVALSRGIVRAAFTSIEDARAWASEQAEVQAYWVRAYQRATASEGLRSKSIGER